MGIGMGATMMPTFSGAMQTLRQAQVARASTTLNINQQVGASIGTAVLSVLLANALESRLGTGGGIGAAAAVPPDQRAQVAGKMAQAFGSTYCWALGLVVLAFVIATPLLPKDKPPPVEEPSAEGCRRGAARPRSLERRRQAVPSGALGSLSDPYAPGTADTADRSPPYPASS